MDTIEDRLAAQAALAEDPARSPAGGRIRRGGAARADMTARMEQSLGGPAQAQAAIAQITPGRPRKGGGRGQSPTLSVRLPAEQKRRLEQAAARHGVDPSALVREALTAWLADDARQQAWDLSQLGTPRHRAALAEDLRRISEILAPRA